MRKGVAILFAIVIMLSGAHITIATHFCGGKVVDTKISLAGKLASCDIENGAENIPSKGNYLASHCCDNQLTTVGICNIFTSPVTVFTENSQNLHHIVFLPVIQSFPSNGTSNIYYTSTSPPGRLTATAVNLYDICVFRI